MAKKTDVLRSAVPIPGIGVDIGTAFMRVAVFRNGKVELVPDVDSREDSIPSCVTFTKRGRQFGPAAQGHTATASRNTVTGIKRFIGSNFSESELKALSKAINRQHYHLTAPAKAGDRVMVSVDSTSEGSLSLTAIEIFSMLLLYAKRNAESYLNDAVNEVSITVPQCFTMGQREEVLCAADLAGFKVFRVIGSAESIAMSLAYDFREHERRHVVILDLGASYFNSGIVEIKNGVACMLATDGRRDIGFGHFVDLVADRLTRVAGLQWSASHLNLKPGARRRLRAAAEEAIWELARKETIQVAVESLFEDGRDFKTSLTIERFEELCAKLVKSTIRSLKNLLSMSYRQRADITEIVFTGGGSRVPVLRKHWMAYFSNQTKLPEFRFAQANPEVCGAAIHAAMDSMLEDDQPARLRKLLLVTVSPMSISIAKDSGMVTIVQRGQTIPLKEMTRISLGAIGIDPSSSLWPSVEVLEGSSRGVRPSMRVLGKLDLQHVLKTRQALNDPDRLIEIEASLDKTAGLEIKLTDTVSGFNHTYPILPAVPNIDRIQMTDNLERLKQLDEVEAVRVGKQEEMSGLLESTRQLQIELDGQSTLFGVSERLDEIGKWAAETEDAELGDYQERISQLSNIQDKLKRNSTKAHANSGNGRSSAKLVNLAATPSRKTPSPVPPPPKSHSGSEPPSGPAKPGLQAYFEDARTIDVWENYPAADPVDEAEVTVVPAPENEEMPQPPQFPPAAVHLAGQPPRSPSRYSPRPPPQSSTQPPLQSPPAVSDLAGQQPQSSPAAADLTGQPPQYPQQYPPQDPPQYSPPYPPKPPPQSPPAVLDPVGQQPPPAVPEPVGDGISRLFPASRSEKLEYTDADFEEISTNLRNTDHLEWSIIPRIYTVLRLIGQVDAISLFLAKEMTDIWIPFSDGNLPRGLNQSHRRLFLETQSVVFSTALKLERGTRLDDSRENRTHAHFKHGQILPFINCGVLGAGSQATVDKVMSRASSKEYARKQFKRPSGVQKRESTAFINELKILKAIGHRHCIELIASYSDPRHFALIMSPVAEYNLEAYYGKCKGDADRQSLLRGFFGCLAGVINYLHQNQHVVHQDLKPQNILVCANGQVRVTDFGISRSWEGLTRATTTANQGRTAIYASPEVTRGGPKNESADVWSLGCVFLEMCTVLNGLSVGEMRNFFLDKTRSKSFSENMVPQGGVQAWMDKLRQRRRQGRDNSAVPQNFLAPGSRQTSWRHADDEDDEAHDCTPLKWVEEMLQIDPRKRTKPDELLEMAVAASTHNRLVFCGSCCFHGQSRTELVDSDDVWEGSDDGWEGDL